jgi:hypothetical protein
MKKALKKIDKDDMKQLIQAIKQFSKDTKDDEIMAASSKVSSKDILFYYLAQHSALETRVTRIETTQKMMCWFIGITLTIIGLGISVLKW